MRWVRDSYRTPWRCGRSVRCFCNVWSWRENKTRSVRRFPRRLAACNRNCPRTVTWWHFFWTPYIYRSEIHTSDISILPSILRPCTCRKWIVIQRSSPCVLADRTTAGCSWRKSCICYTFCPSCICLYRVRLERILLCNSFVRFVSFRNRKRKTFLERSWGFWMVSSGNTDADPSDIGNSLYISILRTRVLPVFVATCLWLFCRFYTGTDDRTWIVRRLYLACLSWRRDFENMPDFCTFGYMNGNSLDRVFLDNRSWHTHHTRSCKNVFPCSCTVLDMSHRNNRNWRIR